VCTHNGFSFHLQTSRVSKAVVGLDECVLAFPHLGLEGFLPTIRHWVQATHDARIASRRRQRANNLPVSLVANTTSSHDESENGRRAFV